jgi:sigma-B regulation protein RsbU (phosphoserine phosphatase)
VQNDARLARVVEKRSGFETRSLLCAPMSFSDRPLGAIQVVNKPSENGCSSESGIHPLQGLVSSAAPAIANARMAAAAIEHERALRELGLAAEIQRNLLPAPRPRPFPIHGVCSRFSRMRSSRRRREVLVDALRGDSMVAFGR